MTCKRAASRRETALFACESAGAVAAVVLVDPADDADEAEGHADVADPETNGEAEDDQTRAEGECDRPPAPRAEVPELRVAVVDVRFEAVLRQLPALSGV